jgi:hypothetical protein
MAKENCGSMIEDLKTIDFSKSYPYFRAYRPRLSRLNNGCLTSIWIFLALWLVLCVSLIASASDDNKGGVIAGAVFASFFVLFFGAIGISLLRGIRTKADAKWELRHPNEMKQATFQRPTAATAPVNEVSANGGRKKETILFLAANPFDTTALRLS